MTLKVLLVFCSLVLGWINAKTPPEFQKENIVVAEDRRNNLIGEFSRQELEQKPFSRWFKRGYKNYKPEKKALKTIKENISDYEIVYVMGTWCADSRRQIPKFYHILDEAGYNTNTITSFGLDYHKKTPGHIERDLEIKMIPTIIFYKEGKEVNRFVEFPVETLEKDIAKIVSQQDYKNSYADF